MTFADPSRRCGTARKAATGCLCAACSYARVRRRRVDRRAEIRLEAAGPYNGFVDAGPARRHVQRLLDGGMTRHQIALAAGLGDGGRTIIRNLVVGQPHAGQPPARRLRPATAAALLRVPLQTTLPAEGALCDGTGTRRRLQALVATGWPQCELARRLGSPSGQLQVARAERVSSTTALRVRDLYARLAALPGPSTAARRYAARHGWVGPAAWTSSTIDDPAAVPRQPGADEPYGWLRAGLRNGLVAS